VAQQQRLDRGALEVIYDHVVVGGGIVGVSTAWNLLRVRPDAGVLLLEKEPELGRHQTGHNSGVIHAGIYYEPGSLKAQLCRRGSAMTRELAQEHGIPFTMTGKLLVATNARELSRMDALLERAGRNGIKAEVLDQAELRRREPMVAGLGALFITETSVIDYREVTRVLADLVRKAGGEFRTGVEVTGITETTDLVRLQTSQGLVETRHAVFCGGLQGDRLAALAGLELDLRIVPFRGEYFDLPSAKWDLVSHLIYPIPDPSLPFLGVHLTRTVTGALNVGPNAVLGLAREKYRKLSFDRRDAADIMSFPGMWGVARQHWRTGVREMRNSLWKRGYLRECQKYCPSLRLDDLLPREAGIRAQAVMRDGTLVHDFLLRNTPRTLHVLNAPSPAATSALPIGQMLAEKAVAAA
jgi:L-2-hydroxyglutarate oxidase